MEKNHDPCSSKFSPVVIVNEAHLLDKEMLEWRLL